MMRNSLSLVVLACAALFSGCDGNPLEPDASRAISELHLSPPEGTLFTIGTLGTLQLNVTALNDQGEFLDVSRSVIFASSGRGFQHRTQDQRDALGLGDSGEVTDLA